MPNWKWTNEPIQLQKQFIVQVQDLLLIFKTPLSTTKTLITLTKHKWTWYQVPGFLESGHWIRLPYYVKPINTIADIFSSDSNNMNATTVKMQCDANIKAMLNYTEARLKRFLQEWAIEKADVT